MLARRGVVSVCVVAGAAGLALAAPGEAPADRGSVAKLRTKGCPSYVVPVERRYSRKELRAALKKKRFNVFRGRKARLDPPVNWNKDPHNDRGFRGHLQSLNWLDILLGAHARSGNRGALRQARDLALDWVRANPSASRSASPLAWVNKNVGERAPYLGYVARAAACEGMLRGGQARTLVQALRRHGDWLYRGNYYPSNHGLFMDMGLLLLADRYGRFLPGARKWERRARHRFPRTLAKRVSPEGAWLEHSAGYHFLAMDLARRFLEFGGRSRRIAHLHRKLRKAAAWFVSPGGRIAAIGDSEFDRAPRRVRRRAKRLRGLRVMRKAGYAFVRSRRGYLAVSASFHNVSHKHSDEASFELYEDGTRVVTGPGKYSFDRDRRRRYVVSAKAHSVLTVDGRDFARNGRRAYGSAIVRAKRKRRWFSIVARNPLLRRRGVRHRRTFLYRPGRTLIVIDRVRSRHRHRYRRYVQLGPGVSIKRRKPAKLRLRSERFAGCLHDSSYRRKRRADRSAVRGRRRPIQGFTFPRYKQAVPRWTVSYRSRGRTVRHVMAFDLEGGCSRLPGDEAIPDDVVPDGLEGLLDDLLPGLDLPPRSRRRSAS